MSNNKNLVSLYRLKMIKEEYYFKNDLLINGKNKKIIYIHLCIIHILFYGDYITLLLYDPYYEF